MKMFVKLLPRALAVLLAATVVLGVAYPLVILSVGQALFPYQANGSVIEVDGKAVGSELLAQWFSDDGHMWGRVMDVDASGSGVDPGISVAAAEYQIPRIASATGLSTDELESIVTGATTDRFLGVFGERSVNVLKVNLAIDAALGE